MRRASRRAWGSPHLLTGVPHSPRPCPAYRAAAAPPCRSRTRPRARSSPDARRALPDSTAKPKPPRQGRPMRTRSPGRELSTTTLWLRIGLLGLQGRDRRAPPRPWELPGEHARSESGRPRTHAGCWRFRRTGSMSRTLVASLVPHGESARTVSRGRRCPARPHGARPNPACAGTPLTMPLGPRPRVPRLAERSGRAGRRLKCRGGPGPARQLPPVHVGAGRRRGGRG